MIPWMREKFNEKRAKWLARSKRSGGSPADESPRSSSHSHSQRTDASDAESLSGSSLNVHTAESETQTDGGISASNSRPLVGGGSCVLRTPSPARRRRIHLELQLQRREERAEHQKAVPQDSPTPTHQQQANGLFLRKSAHTNRPGSSTSGEADDASRPGESILVRVICPSSRVLIFKTDVNKRLNELKSEVILELSDDPDSIQLFAPDVRHLNPRYRLYRAEYFGGELNEGDTLAQLKVRNNETFILSPRRNTLPQTVSRIREVPGPNEQLVESATRYVPVNCNQLPTIDINEIFQQSNIQYDVRKVLISLAQASAAVIGAGPYAPRLIAMLKQRLINRRNQQADTLQCLVDMGFKRELAAFALKAHNGIYSTTMEWLIQNQNEENPQEPPGMNMQHSLSSISPSTIVTNNETIENTAALIEIVRIYSHRDSPPSDEIVESLTEMGFEETAVLAALKKTGNNKASACEWLCDNRSGSVIELREGLAPDSPILKVILEMPQVQMTLSNPKTFLAFLGILENEHAIRVWRGDNDTTSVITHILQKYHEEKHVLGINQFYTNRW
ncbi:ubiquitin-associated domain-containing protein 1 isoform X1 [Drosophila mauritiana]|uniref:Ubiquitin-associated domain-containing protein 1 isoform X1 n=1 Tax=Drosophila mauritiana TaxID=7226 RepID=A0A6P8JEN0_DROMA|nr:ubiquitin-associated domain-containing protein 1 isoform X1 [Drosophila mauritiana]